VVQAALVAQVELQVQAAQVVLEAHPVQAVQAALVEMQVQVAQVE
jgi:hypothetical protein